MSVLTKSITLKLNSLWQPTGYISVGEAVVAMNGMPGGSPPAMALDMISEDVFNLVGWDEWLTLPVRGSEPAIGTKNGPIRAPLVIIDQNYDKMPLKTPKLTNRGILERDNYIDQYTGEKLHPSEATVDHVIAKDLWRRRGLKGNPNCWENMVCCARDRNHKKGNRTNGSQGLCLIRKPKAPKSMPLSFFIKEAKLPHHAAFVSR
jgi:hypothetical protein